MNLTIKTPADLEAERAAHLRATTLTEAQAYLDSTDWLVVRQAETGKKIPVDVVKKRAAARKAAEGADL